MDLVAACAAEDRDHVSLELWIALCNDGKRCGLSGAGVEHDLPGARKLLAVHLTDCSAFNESSPAKLSLDGVCRVRLMDRKQCFR